MCRSVVFEEVGESLVPALWLPLARCEQMVPLDILLTEATMKKDSSLTGKMNPIFLIFYSALLDLFIVVGVAKRPSSCSSASVLFSVPIRCLMKCKKTDRGALIYGMYWQGSSDLTFNGTTIRKW
ncbi:hypothetical protein ZWY2020_050472 [Hordeum vulgare]|nr:hypothetical protein ZWY2020_050472 [Hordeum vulgare]